MNLGAGDVDRFEELANKAIELRRKAEEEQKPEVAKLGMDSFSPWVKAYRVIFEELKPQIDQTGMWVGYYQIEGSSFVEDVIQYTNALEANIELSHTVLFFD